MPEVGELTPDFSLPTTSGDLSLRRYPAGRKLVIAFYVENMTPGWGQMISSLKEGCESIVDLGADLIGVSADILESRAAFCGALGGCPFPALPSDADLSVARAYGAVSEDGRSGIRSICVVDADLTVIHRISWYQPGNVGQFMEIFLALGVE